MPSSRRSANSKSSRRRTRYLSYDDLTDIAFALSQRLFSDWLGPMPLLTTLGGEEGAGRVSGILELPRQSAGGRPAYPSLHEKAAVLFRSFVLNHPFVDGNKRMATAVCLVFLDVNEEIVCATQAEMVDLALAVATGTMRDLQEISAWLRARSRSVGEIRESIATDRVGEMVAWLPGGHSLNDRVLLAETIAELRGRPFACPPDAR